MQHILHSQLNTCTTTQFWAPAAVHTLVLPLLLLGTLQLLTHAAHTHGTQYILEAPAAAAAAAADMPHAVACPVTRMTHD